MSLTTANITQLQAGIREGRWTRQDIIAAHLERIEQINPMTNTFVEVRAAKVLEEASAADRKFGETIAGPLDGVPMSVKDTFGIAELKRTDGIRAFADRKADTDDLIVTQLRSSGALLLGHSNVPDMCARWNTVSGLYGTARNPRDLSLTTGGSSGGEAGNIAAGMATVGIGQDYGGSIRVPASFCGLYGLRTSPGLVANVQPIPSSPPSLPFQAMATNGPLARSVDDLEAVFNALLNFDSRDPTNLPVDLIETEAQPTVAVLRSEIGAILDSEIEDKLDKSIEILRDQGYDVAENAFPDLHRAPELWGELVGTDFVQTALPTMGPLLEESCLQHIHAMHGSFDLGPEVAKYSAAWIERAHMLAQYAEFSQKYPLVIAPVAGMPTPPLDFDHMLTRSETTHLFDQMRNVLWVNLLGLPALSLPNGIQLIAPRYHDRNLIRVARDIEQQLTPVNVATPVSAS